MKYADGIRLNIALLIQFFYTKNSIEIIDWMFTCLVNSVSIYYRCWTFRNNPLNFDII